MMKRYILSLTAASALVLAGVASAGQQLTSAQMDGITAGGSATGDAAAAAYGYVTTILHQVNADSTSTALNPGQLGGIFTIDSHVDSTASAGATNSDGVFGTAAAAAASVGNTTGTGLSDTDNHTNVTASMLLLPFSQASANGTGNATSVVIGLNAQATGSSAVAATLGN
jgi:hypothetical protein